MKRILFLMTMALAGLTLAGSICCHTANNTVNAECIFDGKMINVSYVESEDI